MQKNEISLMPAKVETDPIHYLSLSSLTTYLSQKTFIATLSSFYSSMLDEEVTPWQTVYYLYAQVFGLCALMPFAIGLGWRFCFMLIFCWAVGKTRKHHA